MGRNIEYLDPRWEWHEITNFGSAVPVWIRGRCNHTELVPVRSVLTGELLAWLCKTCDTQLPADLMEDDES